MSEGLPSMTALLGLLAIAGYQNRDKLAEMFGGASRPAGAPGGPAASAPVPGVGELFNGLATTPGSFLSGGLGHLVDQFTQRGQGATVQSWVKPGPNQAIALPQLEQAIGPDILARLTQSTGLSREELLARLSKELPQAVDNYTPDGRVPA